MRSFIRQHLDPADRLGEVVFGLIMALGFTAAVRLGLAEADNRALFISILGCNLAWAIVDGVTFVLMAYFERGRNARLARDVVAATSEEEALHLVDEEVTKLLGALTTAVERERLARSVLANLRRQAPQPVRLQRDDLLAGVAVALLIMLATLPVVLPCLLVPNPNLAVRLSNLIALVQLFLVGVWWGRAVGQPPLRIATALTLVGVVLVLIAIALGDGSQRY